MRPVHERSQGGVRQVCQSRLEVTHTSMTRQLKRILLRTCDGDDTAEREGSARLTVHEPQVFNDGGAKRGNAGRRKRKGTIRDDLQHKEEIGWKDKEYCPLRERKKNTGTQ